MLIVLDVSVPIESRMKNGQKMIQLLISCILRADRDMSTTEAGKDLQSGVEKILKKSSVKDSVAQYMAWPAFSSSSQKTKKPSSVSQSGQNPPSIPPWANHMSNWCPPGWNLRPPFNVGGTKFCSYCYQPGHTEDHCFSKQRASGKKKT